jgi:uncharacterized membrane protein
MLLNLFIGAVVLVAGFLFATQSTYGIVAKVVVSFAMAMIGGYFVKKAFEPVGPCS